MIRSATMKPLQELDCARVATGTPQYEYKVTQEFLGKKILTNA